MKIPSRELWNGIDKQSVKRAATSGGDFGRDVFPDFKIATLFIAVKIDAQGNRSGRTNGNGLRAGLNETGRTGRENDKSPAFWAPDRFCFHIIRPGALLGFVLESVLAVGDGADRLSCDADDSRDIPTRQAGIEKLLNFEKFLFAEQWILLGIACGARRLMYQKSVRGQEKKGAKMRKKRADPLAWSAATGRIGPAFQPRKRVL